MRRIDGNDILEARVVGDALRLIVARKGELILVDIRLKSL